MGKLKEDVPLFKPGRPEDIVNRPQGCTSFSFMRPPTIDHFDVNMVIKCYRCAMDTNGCRNDEIENE